MIQSLSLVMMLLLGCAVEAGNPVDGNNGGTVKLSIVANDSDGLSLTGGSKQLTLFIESIILIGSDSYGSIQETLTPLVNEVDLYQASDEITVADGVVTPGTYEQIVIKLRDNRPFYYSVDGVSEDSISFAETGHKSFYVNQTIVLEQATEESVVLDFDLAESLKVNGQGRIFDPQLRSLRKKQVFSYENQLAREDGLAVCAYLYEPLRPPHPPREGARPMPPPPHFEQQQRRPPPPPPGPVGRMPTEYATKADVVLDTDAACGGAFAKTAVTDGGRYFFPRLKPGHYRFRAFYSDGSYSDEEEDVALVPAFLLEIEETDDRSN